MSTMSTAHSSWLRLTLQMVHENGHLYTLGDTVEHGKPETYINVFTYSWD